MNGSIMGMTRAEIKGKLDEIVDFAGIERYLDTPVKRFSSGMTVRLGFAVAAFLEPEILVVDEVLAVGDAEFQKKAIGKMKDVSSSGGRTVLFVSHNMDSILNLCNNGILLENGTMKYSGDVKSTVSKYLAGDSTNTHFIQNTSRSSAFVHEASFVGEGQIQKGMFSFDENVHIKASIKKTPGTIVDKAAVAGICLYTDRGLMMCVAEQPLRDLQTSDEVIFDLEYPSGVLMPGNYKVQIDIHVPNVCYLDKQETISFSIFDNGSEFLKYNGANNGVVMLRPNVIKTLA